MIFGVWLEKIPEKKNSQKKWPFEKSQVKRRKMNFVISPLLHKTRTKRFFVFERREINGPILPVGVFVDLNCQYTRQIVKDAISRRPWCHLIELEGASNRYSEVIQFSDFENIQWEEVMSGRQRASSFLIRKGLSRKAQLSIQIKRFLSKNPGSILSKASPYTLIIETWNAFEVWFSFVLNLRQQAINMSTSW